MSVHPEECGRCGGPVVMVEYRYGSKYRYDGVSEYACMKLGCDWRIGRWCEQELEANMMEPPFCTGGGHPRVFDIEQADETSDNRPIQET